MVKRWVFETKKINSQTQAILQAVEGRANIVYLVKQRLNVRRERLGSEG